MSLNTSISQYSKTYSILTHELKVAINMADTTCLLGDTSGTLNGELRP